MVNSIELRVDRLSGRKDGHPNRPATRNLLGLTIIGNSNMKKIKLTQGKVALVDDKDYDELNKHKWHAHLAFGNYYAQRWSKGGAINMHRVIMNPPDGLMVDHRTGNTLDNQRHNLRECTNSQNQMNSRIRRNNTSGYKGVTWSKNAKRWAAAFRLNGKHHHIGYYFCLIKAAKAYNEAVKLYFGEFANLNIFQGETK